jgi:hypothetical protein
MSYGGKFIRRAKMIKPHMYYWTKDELNREWEVLLEGEYEEYPDGNNIVADLDVTHYKLNKEIVAVDLVPQEVLDFAEMLLDSTDTYTDIQREYEMVYKRG